MPACKPHIQVECGRQLLPDESVMTAHIAARLLYALTRRTSLVRTLLRLSFRSALIDADHVGMPTAHDLANQSVVAGSTAAPFAAPI